MDDIEGPVKPTFEEPQRKSRSVNLLDTLRFEEEEDYEDEINLKFFFSRILLKSRHPGKLHSTFFSPAWSQNYKTFNVWWLVSFTMSGATFSLNPL